MRRLGISALLLASASPAVAGEKVLYQPAPDWVKPAPAVDPVRLGADAPVLLVLDTQQRLQDGEVWGYVESATRAATADVLGKLGTIQLPWQPSQGDLIIHKAQILRGTQRIDLIAGKDPFSVLRREEKLGERILDGQLTATLPVEGLQVGDVLDVAFSITRRDPTLAGNMQTASGMVALPTRLTFGRARLLWPEKSDVRWRAYADGVTATPVTAGGYQDLTIPMPLPKQPEQPSDAPARFLRLDFVEASSFPDWAAVARVMAPLYRADGLIAPGSPLAAEVAKIKAASPDPLRRTALALQLVQDQVRYLLMGMNTGNYVPQSPAQTWASRYGDCKAKTLLLLAMLHELGIEAEAVLASSQLGDAIPRRLPGVGAFDHVLVHATVGGRSLWLDGTDRGARFEDIADTPAFGWVLPVRAAGAEPVAIALQPAARPLIAVTLDFDETAGVELPAPYRASMTMRGQLAETVRAAAAQGSSDELEKMARELAKNYVGDDAVLTEHAISFDEAAGTATVRTAGIAYPGWTRKDARLRNGLDHLVGQIKFEPDRTRAAWRDIPVATGSPGTLTITTTYRLPNNGAGFAVEGPLSYRQTVGGEQMERDIALTGGVLTVRERNLSLGREVAVQDIPAERQKLAATKRAAAFVQAPADYPALWDVVAADRRAKLLDPLTALYTRRVAAKPDERDRLTDRAWFLERIYDRKAALADLDKAIAIEPTLDSYLNRSRLHYDLGNRTAAMTDAVAAQTLDPGADRAIRRVAFLRSDAGDVAGAVTLLQDKIDAGGDTRIEFILAKASAQLTGGQAKEALATLDDAIADAPKDPDLLNFRCWTRGTAGVELEVALKDCTRAIELADDANSALDSRAMVYFKLGRFPEALADLDSVLGANAEQSGSLFLRGVTRRRAGRNADGDADLAAARLISPQIDREYKRFGVAP